MPPSMEMNGSQPALLESLSSIRRRVRVLTLLFGIGLVMAATVGLILLVVLLDYLLNLPAVPRLMFLAASVAGVGYLIWNYLAKPLAARLTIGDVAGHLENAFPQFDDRLRSTVDFVRTELPGSQSMKQRVVAEADQMARSVNLNNAIVMKPVALSLAAGFGALALSIVLALTFSDFAAIARDRLMMGNTKWPRTQQIDLFQKLPAKVPAGQRMDLKMKLAKGDKAGLQAIVYIKYDDGAPQRQIMTRNADGTYSANVDARGSNMSVWFKAGDDQTEPQTIAVVQRLAITRVEAIVTPPAYAKMESATLNLGEAPANVVAGSQVKVRVAFNKALAQGVPVRLESVKPEQKVPELPWTNETASIAIGTYNATESLRFRIHATDVDNFENNALEEFDVIVRPDQTPTVMIETPRRNEDRTPVAMVHLEALAEDDFDISSMTLMVDRIGDKKHWEIKLADWAKVDSSGERRRFRVKHDWELEKLEGAELKPGDVLEYFVRVTDNYDYNGAKHEPVDSGHLKINIISQETLSVQLTEAIKAVGEKVRTARNAQDRTQQETHNLKEDTKNKDVLDQGDKTALTRLNDQQSTIASQSKQMAQQMQEIQKRMEENRSTNQELKDIAQEVKSTLNETAENQMSEAARKLAEANQRADAKNARKPDGKIDPQKAQENNKQRNEAMEQSEKKQQESSDQLAKAMEKMAGLDEFNKLLNDVRQALKDQQELSKATQEAGRETIGKKENELTPEQRKKLDDLAKKQEEQSKKTEKLKNDLEKASERNKKNDPSSSEAMKQAAQQAQQQQVSPSQQQASQAAQKNQQAQAQAKQKQAELGLQMMLSTLKEAEKRKLEQLAKELAKIQELIANLVRRQAGHNIDNLLIQGNDAVKQINDELLAKAERVRDQMPPKPEPAGLTNFQTTTERNTRDVSKTAEEMSKGGAEISALLTKAAGLMERAIISLKEVKLPEAYDPSQVKALSALEEAKQRADQALAEVQKQQEDANRETIRQVYEKLKAEQELINKETARIDGSPRLPDGTLNRIDSVNLGKLPGQQGGLSDRAQKLDEDLVALGGIVYVWANKDIVSSMNEVKDDLGKQKIGKPTQSEQTRIVEQLDAMIRNLAVKPKPSDFNQPPGGGGQAGTPKPRLPSEAELRLLKELQIAVNKSTKTIDAQPNPDKPKLVGLGTRQGELRGLLDQLIQKASKGEVKLDPEPDPKDKLPEEADAAKIENQELDDWLRGSKSGDDQLTDDVKLVGQRMARSKQRLALDNDPGKTTQTIQDRILNNLDHLIQMARQQQAQASSKPGQQPGKGQQQKGPKPGEQQMGQQNQGRQPGEQSQGTQGQNSAKNEKGNGTDNTNASGQDIRQKASEWGGLTPRERQAIIEGTHEKTIEKYQRLTRDYYEQMSQKGSQER